MSTPHPGPCPNCGRHMKRPYVQEQHNIKCSICPSPQELADMFQSGEAASLTAVAEAVSTDEISVSSQFVRQLLVIGGLRPSGTTGKFVPISKELRYWREKSERCVRCGLLIIDEADKVPKEVAGDPSWFVAREWNGENRSTWRVRRMGTGTKRRERYKGRVCNLCYNELTS